MNQNLVDIFGQELAARVQHFRDADFVVEVAASFENKASDSLLTYINTKQNHDDGTD